MENFDKIIITHYDEKDWNSLKKLKVKLAQSCRTLCNPMDYTAHGILQARIMEWVAIPFSRASS